MELNIAENRNHLNYSKWIYVKRILWTFGKFFFRNSPRIAFGYRNTILRLFGAKIGKHVHIYSSTVIWFPWNLEIGDWSAIGEETLIYNLGKVTIGEKATVSHRVHVCAAFHAFPPGEGAVGKLKLTQFCHLVGQSVLTQRLIQIFNQ